MEVSIATPACTLVPAVFFNAETAREELAKVSRLSDTDEVRFVEVPQYSAVLIYSVNNSISGEGEESQPEMFYLLKDMGSISDYNKILASYVDGYLFLAIAQGKSLLLSNVYRAQDFTTAEYYIFLAMKSLQLNPEVSTIWWRSAIGPEEEMSLYRYFKSVDRI